MIRLGLEHMTPKVTLLTFNNLTNLVSSDDAR